MQTGCSISIEASLTSIQSTGQTEIHVPQKSHLFSIILIIFYQKCRIMKVKTMPIIIFTKIINHNYRQT